VTKVRAYRRAGDRPRARSRPERPRDSLAGELPALITSVFQALRTARRGEAEKAAEAPLPAVPVKESVTPEYLVRLEDGKKLKMLKRSIPAPPCVPRRREGAPACR
jgi:hypothetical protein